MTSCCLCPNASKYKCPSCERSTCSLRCVKNHKETFSCEGKRDPTKFIALKAFTDADLINDYRFLEEVNRLADKSSRENRSFVARRPFRARKSWWTPREDALEKFARTRGIKFRRLPKGFSKRSENTSFYSTRTKSIHWRIRWHFPRAEADYVDDKVHENTLLNKALEKYINVEKGDPILTHRLKMYWKSEVSLLLRNEYSPANQIRYFKLDLTQSLGENLRNKTLVEYPTLIVALPSELSQYKLETNSKEETEEEEEEESSESESETESEDSEEDTCIINS
ncbi:box C/D snoRNA protein 1-like [Oscarella lobularis]|uniref:box C/D snoRNA protein 1-like n=1 Tax=Oscarella lobularis TaxID=121494 RepID=UPI003313B0E1